MADKQMIIIMSKLAVYDKNYAKDKKKAEYFRHDYVYRQNMSTRFFTIIGSLIVVVFYFMHRIIIDHLDILDIPGKVMIDLIRVGIFVILVQFAYSMIGFSKYSREYNEAYSRINEYFDNVDMLTQRKRILRRDEERAKGGHYEPDIDKYS